MRAGATIPSLGILVPSAVLGLLGSEVLHAADTTDEIPTVVVSANRTPEDVQDVPMDVSVVSGVLANQIGVTDTQSLADVVPGLLFNRQANTAIPFIRGVGSPVGEAGDEPSVAFYVDDVYEPAAAASLANFSSVDRIEVDKGPQGTLFGRNATGGVVQVFTRNPTSEPELDLSLGGANYDTQSGSLYATGSLGRTLTGNIALYGAQQHDGWGHDATTGASIYTGWNYGGRVKLLWTPTEGMSALLTLDHDDTRTEEGTVLRAFPGTTSLNPSASDTDHGLAAPSGFYDGNDVPATHSITYQSGVSLKVVQDLGWGGITSITAWRQTNSVEGIDEDPGVALADALTGTKEDTWTQEIRLSSGSGLPMTWIAGLFYYHDTAGYDPLYLFGSAFLPLASLETFGIQRTHSWAGFAQAKRTILPNTELTLGARYTSDERTLEASTVSGTGPNVAVANSPQSATWSRPTFRAALDHHFTDNVMSYIAYNRGFKSGLFNPIVVPGALIDPPVAPETLDAYTAGAKSELLDRRLIINLEGYYYNYKNIQIEQIVSGATHITNAAGALIRGIDIDTASTPVAGITISASLEIQNGRYTSFRNGLFYVYDAQSGGNCLFAGAGTCPGTVVPPNYDAATGTWDLRGNHTVETPPFSSSLAIEDVIPSDIGEFTLAANWTHTGDYYADVDNGLGQLPGSSPQNDRQPLLNLLNASVQWSTRDKQWQLRAWGKNLTGERYWSYAQEVVFVTQYSAAPPRTFGITLSRRW
jgi:iron complex outermembrane recepter protein